MVNFSPVSMELDGGYLYNQVSGFISGLWLGEQLSEVLNLYYEPILYMGKWLRFFSVSPQFTAVFRKKKVF